MKWHNGLRFPWGIDEKASVVDFVEKNMERKKLLEMTKKNGKAGDKKREKKEKSDRREDYSRKVKRIKNSSNFNGKRKMEINGKKRKGGQRGTRGIILKQEKLRYT